MEMISSKHPESDQEVVPEDRSSAKVCKSIQCDGTPLCPPGHTNSYGSCNGVPTASTRPGQQTEYGLSRHHINTDVLDFGNTLGYAAPEGHDDAENPRNNSVVDVGPQRRHIEASIEVLNAGKTPPKIHSPVALADSDAIAGSATNVESADLSGVANRARANAISMPFSTQSQLMSRSCEDEQDAPVWIQTPGGARKISLTKYLDEISKIGANGSQRVLPGHVNTRERPQATAPTTKVKASKRRKEKGRKADACAKIPGSVRVIKAAARNAKQGRTNADATRRSTGANRSSVRKTLSKTANTLRGKTSAVVDLSITGLARGRKAEAVAACLSPTSTSPEDPRVDAAVLPEARASKDLASDKRKHLVGQGCADIRCDCKGVNTPPKKVRPALKSVQWLGSTPASPI